MGDLCYIVGNTDILVNCVTYMVALCTTATKRTTELGVSITGRTPTQPLTKGPILSTAEHKAQTQPSQCCSVVLRCSEFHSKSSSKIAGTFVCCLFLNGFHLPLDLLFNVLCHKPGQAFLYKYRNIF